MQPLREIRSVPWHHLQEVVRRQALVCEKLRRDGGYPCEIRAALRALRSAETKLRAAQRAGRVISLRIVRQPEERAASG